MSAVRRWGAGFVPWMGSKRVMLARWLFALFAWVATGWLLGATTAGSSRAQGPSQPWPLHQILAVIADVAPWGAVVALAIAVARWGLDALLMAVLVSVAAEQASDPHAELAPGPEGLTLPPPQPKLSGRLSELGWARLPALLRVSFLAGVLGVAGVAAIAYVFRHLRGWGDSQGLGGVTQMIGVPLAQGVLSAGWLVVIGTISHWARVVVIADQRRVTRRAWVIALRVLERARAGGLAHLLVVSLLQISGTAVVGLSAPFLGYSYAWLAWPVFLALETFVWHGLVRGSTFVYRLGSCEDLHHTPDAGWGWMRRSRRRAPLPRPTTGAPLQKLTLSR